MDALPRLCDRLAAVADCVDGCRFMADIGTDHALLPAFLLLTGKAEGALLCDISNGPLGRAAATVAEYGLQNSAHLRLSDGFSAVGEDEFDSAFICGMGGLNIIGILAAAKVFGTAKKLYLQPQTDVISLRAWLKASGFSTLRERGVTDRGKAYCIICAESVDFSPAPAQDYIKFDPLWAEDAELLLGKLDPSLPGDAAFLRRTLKLYEPKAGNTGLPGYQTLINTLTEALNAVDI